MELKFRCSQLGKLMTNDRTGKGLGEVAKELIINVWIEQKFKRYELITSKFMEKGKQREEDAITLLSLTKNEFYKKNSERLSNNFITGEPDIFKGENILNAEEIFDTKTSWSANTFFKSINQPLPKDYVMQGHGYMWLTGAARHTVAYCLVNGTLEAINDEKRKAQWKYGLDFETDENYLNEIKQIEINHIFDMQSFKKEYPFYDFENDVWLYDIPKEQRIKTFTFERDEEIIKQIENRVILANQWALENLNME